MLILKWVTFFLVAIKVKNTSFAKHWRQGKILCYTWFKMWFSFANYLHFAMTSNEFLFAGLFIQVLNSRGFSVPDLLSGCFCWILWSYFKMALISIEGWANMTIKEYLNVLCNVFRYASSVVSGYRNFLRDFWTTYFLNSLLCLKIVLYKRPICFTTIKCRLSCVILYHVFDEEKIELLLILL